MLAALMAVSFSVQWRGGRTSASEYVRTCSEITNDEAKCQLLAFALFGRLSYSGKRNNKLGMSSIYAIQNLIRREDLKKQFENDDNSWIPEDANDKFFSARSKRYSASKIIEKEEQEEETDDSEEYPNVICDKPNAVSRHGKCVCHKNHPYGDPDKTGCWGCSIPCASGASCISQDFCRCPNFYIGDGIRNCTMHTPVVLSVKGRISDSTVVVMIEEVPWIVPYPVYCRIGYDVTNGTLMSRNRIECKSLAMLHSKAIVAVSWDKNTWSKEEPKLDFEGIPWILSISEFCVILVVTFIISCFAFRYYRKYSDVVYKETDLFELAFQI